MPENGTFHAAHRQLAAISAALCLSNGKSLSLHKRVKKGQKWVKKRSSHTLCTAHMYAPETTPYLLIPTHLVLQDFPTCCPNRYLLYVHRASVSKKHPPKHPFSTMYACSRRHKHMYVPHLVSKSGFALIYLYSWSTQRFSHKITSQHAPSLHSSLKKSRDPLKNSPFGVPKTH